MQDKELVKKVNKIMKRKIGENFSISQDGMLTMKGKVYVPDVKDLRKLIMEERIAQHMQCIRVVPRCIELSRKITGSPV